MNFQGLKNVESADTYLDQAFSSAKKKADTLRAALPGSRGNRLEKSKRIELEKIKTIRAVLTKQLGLILRSFPSLDSLPEFYNELVRNTLEYDELKK
ncbi:MAG: hypothetical protein KJ574_00685 [Nanoarchaeota archaeon]|nr:hypothetical protein [Nanoarchaeota archaeon]